MVVEARTKSRSAPPPQPDLGYLALFLGLRINEMVRERMREAGFEKVRDSHGYVIQHLVEKERSITELAQRMEVTQQAASKTVAELAELGVVELAPAADRRSRRARLSLRGWSMVRLGRQVRKHIENRLIHVAGAEQYESTKAAVTAYLEALGGMERVRSRRVRLPQ